MIRPDSSTSLPLPGELTRRIPYSGHLGMRLIPQPGTDPAPLFYLPFQDALVGNRFIPALHGGAVAGFMESAALLHLIMSQGHTTRLPKTVNFHIDYLRAAGPRDSFAQCEVAKLGRRVALVQVRCWQRHHDRPTALARAHYLWEEVREPGELAGDLTPNP